MANGASIILPNNALFGEMRVKQLAGKFLDVAQGYDNRELLTALAVCAGCTMRARYTTRGERESAFTTTVNIMNHCKDQL